MSKENIKNFVNSLEKGDNLAAADAFKASIADKVSSALDDRKSEVAQSMFTGNDVAADTPAEVASDEVAQ